MVQLLVVCLICRLGVLGFHSEVVPGTFAHFDGIWTILEAGNPGTHMERVLADAMICVVVAQSQIARSRLALEFHILAHSLEVSESHTLGCSLVVLATHIVGLGYTLIVVEFVSVLRCTHKYFLSLVPRRILCMNMMMKIALVEMELIFAFAPSRY